jgi:hypothetical protein
LFPVFTTMPLRAAIISVPSGMAISMHNGLGVKWAVAVSALGQAEWPPPRAARDNFSGSAADEGHSWHSAAWV